MRGKARCQRRTVRVDTPRAEASSLCKADIFFPVRQSAQKVYMQHKIAELDPLLDGQAVADRLALKDRAFRKLVHQGLPYYRINQRVWRFRLSEVELWLAERRKGGSL